MTRSSFATVLLAAALATGAALAGDPGPLYVRMLQRHLLLHGYDPGPASGELTGRTRWAVAAYRQDAQLPSDTDLLDVLSHLRYAAPRVMAEERTAPRHATADVAAAQLLLVRLGYLAGPIDGRLGDETRAAVAAYRAIRSLPEGEVDDTLLAALTESAERRGVQVPSVIAALRQENG